MTKSHSQAVLIFHCKISTWNCDVITFLERIRRKIFLYLSLSALIMVTSYSQPPPHHTLCTCTYWSIHTHIISGLSISSRTTYSEQNTMCSVSQGCKYIKLRNTEEIQMWINYPKWLHLPYSQYYCIKNEPTLLVKWIMAQSCNGLLLRPLIMLS